MAKVAVLKLKKRPLPMENAPSWPLPLCAPSQKKLYNFCSRGAIAMALLSQNLTIHLFRLNYTFKPFDTILLIGSKLVCNLGT